MIESHLGFIVTGGQEVNITKPLGWKSEELGRYRQHDSLAKVDSLTREHLSTRQSTIRG